MSHSPSTVLVTGASGYIASWIVKYLLDAGHRVHATVRDPARADSVAHLEALARHAPGTLQLFKADLLEADSFDAAMAGCDSVIHTASPFILENYRNANEALVRPAVEGTRHVLEAANRCASVKRVVLTSSVAAVYGDGIELHHSGQSAFNEQHWNTTSSVRHNPYQYSKAEAERTAWKIHDAQQRWQLITINPGMVYGPSLTRASKSASIGTLLQMGRGQLRFGVPNLVYGVVDVRDVAQAHVLAAFNPEASYRYLLVNREMSMLDIAQTLRRHFGNSYHFPKAQVPKPLVWAFGPLLGPITRKFVSLNVNYPVRFDNARSVALGVKYRPLDNTFREHFQQALDDQLIRKRN